MSKNSMQHSIITIILLIIIIQSSLNGGRNGGVVLGLSLNELGRKLAFEAFPRPSTCSYVLSFKNSHA